MAYKIKEAPRKSGILDETELLSWTDRVLVFVEQNRTAILLGVVLIVVAAVALGGLVWFERHNTGEALVLEGKAQSLYVDRPLDQPEKAQENLGKASELYRQILEQYPRTASARISLFLLGNTLMEQHDLKGATETYERFIKQYPDDEVFVGLAYQRLGYAHLLNGDRGSALEAFSDVLRLPHALNKDQVLFELAKLEEADGDTEKAVTHYNLLIENYRDSPYFNEASLRVKILAPEPEAEKAQSQDEEGDKTVEPEKGGETEEGTSEENKEESLSQGDNGGK